MQSEGWMIIGGVVVAAAGALGWLHRDSLAMKRRSPQGAPAATRVTALNASNLPPNHLAVLGYEGLLVATGATGLVKEIQEKFGYADANFKRDVVPVLQQFSEFVQLLPASESHHHAQPGGLLIHLLEVARNALHFREALKLPQGASPEEQSRLGARWTYGVFLAALLHDIGKPIADVRVTLYDGNPNSGKSWNGLAGSMLEARGISYTVNFPEKRDYSLHQKLPVILLRSMVPVSTLQWLSEDAQLLQLLMGYLSGESKANVLAEIVGKADRDSVSKNLLNGPRTRFASARAVPLIERLMSALRRMLEESGHLPLNRPGAAGFVHDGCVWFVAGTVADRVREYLNKNEVRREGAAGLPEDNSKIFDIWQDYGAVVSNAKGGAMWKIAIQIGEWKETFTVLRFPLSKLYRDPSAYPDECAGQITIVADQDGATSRQPTNSPAANPAAGTPLHQEAGQAASAPIDDGGFEQCRPDTGSTATSETPGTVNTAAPELDPLYEQAVEMVLASGSASISMLQQELQIGFNRAARLLEQMEMDGLVSPANAEGHRDLAGVTGTAANQVVESVNTEQPRPAAADEEFLDESESAAAAFQTPAAKKPPPAAPLAPMAPAISRNDSKRQASAAVERFMAWIQSGLADGSLLYNDSSAMVHFVDEGMLLLTPKIVQEFVKLFGPEGDGNLSGSAADDKAWVKLQREFQKSGYATRNPEIKGSYIFAYATTNTQSSRPVNCYLVRQPERFLNPVPQSNPYFISKASKLQEKGEAS